MSSHFAAIGFPVREMRDYWGLAQRAAGVGERIAAAGGRTIIRWAPGGGPEIWTQTEATGKAVLATPFFASDETYRLAVTDVGSSDDEGFEGWADGWLNPTEDDEHYSGLFPLRVDLVNYAVARTRVQPGRVIPLRLAVILHEAALYPDAQAYDAVRHAAYRPPIQSFASSHHLALDEPPGDGDATALVTGYVAEAREMTNPATGAAYWWIRLATAGVTVSTLADAEVLPAATRAGMVLSGQGWVLGEVLSQD